MLDKSTKAECQRHVAFLVDKILKDDHGSRGCVGFFIIGDYTCEFDFTFNIIDNETGEEI